MATNLANIQKETLAIVNSATTILNQFPELEESDYEKSYTDSINPFKFIIEILKQTKGFNYIIKLLSKFIYFALPTVEAGTKAYLLAKIKDIISCSVNPFINEELIRNGIIFNLEEIDIADTLKYSPFDDKVGNLYYFDTGYSVVEYPIATGVPYGAQYGTIKDTDKPKFTYSKTIYPTDETLTKSDDMNALLWFVINKANKRYVWKPQKYRKDEEFRQDYPHDTKTRCKKEDGIVTLEFHERPQDLRDAYGEPYTKIQTPYSNVLHVFIGDVRESEESELIQNIAKLEKQKRVNDERIRKLKEELIKNENSIRLIDEHIDQLRYELSAGGEQETYNKEYKEEQKNKKELIKRNQEINGYLNGEYSFKDRLQFQLSDIKNQLKTQTEQYFPFFSGSDNRNYYYGKTLMEFNIDYITSMKFFNEKVLTAKLIDALTGILTIDLEFSYKRQLIKDEITKMVKAIVNTDDTVVSDCFFTFSNKDYDEMSRKAELRKAGLLTINGEETSAVKLNADDILSKLNQINEDATKEEKQSIFEGIITELSKELSEPNYKTKETVNSGAELHLIEKLLDTLAYVIVSTVLSPKIYILLLMNLKIIGRETNFNLDSFIGQYKQLIADLIRSIRDQLLTFIENEIKKIISDMTKEIALMLSNEQIEYWSRLMKQLIDCFELFKFSMGNGVGNDFNVADINYADILETNEEPKNNEC